MPPTLLILTHEYPPRHGGIATYVAETAQAAAALGWAVTVAAPRYAVACDAPSPRVLPTPTRGTQGWLDRWRMSRWLARAAIAWDHTTLWLPEPGPLRLWLYADRLRLPQPQRLVLTFHGSELLTLGRFAHRRKRLLRLLRQADAVSTVSHSIADLLGSVAPAFDPASAIIVPGGVRADLLPQLEGVAAAPHREGPPFRLLTVGRIHPRKGQLEVIEALGCLPAELRAQIRYTLVGPVRRASYAERLRQRARALGVVLDGPREAGSAEALASAYAECDLFVLASQARGGSTEGFGLVLLEAAAAGRPVLGTRTGGIGEAIGPDNGVLVAPGDPAALAEAIARLLTDPPRRQALGAAGPAWARRFSWQANAEKLFGSPPPRP